jgi:hypothetical protein
MTEQILPYFGGAEGEACHVTGVDGGFGDGDGDGGSEG